MEIRFREVDPFNCWIWVRFPENPGQGERGYVDTVFDSWFFLGKLGASTPKACRCMRRGSTSAPCTTTSMPPRRPSPP